MAKIMSKKEMIKEQERLKRERKEVSSYEYNFNSETIWIIIFVVLFIGIIFLGINISNGNIDIFTRDRTYDDTTLRENKIMCAGIFDRTDTEYYVLAYDFANEDYDVFQIYVEQVYQGENKIYVLNTGEAINNACLGEKTVVSNEITKLKLASPTLLHIKSGKVIKSYTTKKDIIGIIG